MLDQKLFFIKKYMSLSILNVFNKRVLNEKKIVFQVLGVEVFKKT